MTVWVLVELGPGAGGRHPYIRQLIKLRMVSSRLLGRALSRRVTRLTKGIEAALRTVGRGRNRPHRGTLGQILR